MYVCPTLLISLLIHDFKKKIINKHASQLGTIEIDKGNQNPRFIH